MHSFKDFLGNERIVQTLQLALHQRRLADSHLFAGPEGVGKRSLALMVAKALNCLNRQADFCNECTSCRKIEAGTHPDVLVVGLLEDKQLLQIDQIREARGEVFYQPFEGRFRVIIIEEADRMKEDAANSMLKMLEEPPPSTKIILLTTRFHSLLPTIRSRCQIFSFAPIPLQDVEQFLRERSTLPVEQQLLCARLAGGSVGRALTLDLDLYQSMRQEILEFLNAAVVTHAPNSVMALAEVIGKNRDRFEDYLGIFYLLLQDMFYILNDAPDDRFTNVDILASLRALAQVVDMKWVHTAIRHLDSIGAGLRVNINRPIALEDLAFDLEACARPG